jgi:hypothetical protein
MADPSDVIRLVLADLATLGVVAKPGDAITRAVPEDSPSRRMAFSRPKLLEQTNAIASAGNATITATLFFSFAGHVRLQGAVEPMDLDFYNTGSRLRALFHADSPCATRHAGFSVVVGPVGLAVGGENQGKFFEGDFTLTVRYEDAPPGSIPAT